MSRLLTILSFSKLKPEKRKHISVFFLLFVVGLEGGSYPAPFRTWKSSLPSPIILQATSVEMQVAATLSLIIYLQSQLTNNQLLLLIIYLLLVFYYCSVFFTFYLILTLISLLLFLSFIVLSSCSFFYLLMQQIKKRTQKNKMQTAGDWAELFCLRLSSG